jgi:hypothetical protein
MFVITVTTKIMNEKFYVEQFLIIIEHIIVLIE